MFVQVLVPHCRLIHKQWGYNNCGEFFNFPVTFNGYKVIVATHIGKSNTVNIIVESDYIQVKEGTKLLSNGSDNYYSYWIAIG